MALVLTDKGIWDLITISHPRECWEFRGSPSGAGYGQVEIADGVTVLAHRLAYQDAHGPLDPGQLVLHQCDNPPCCNPFHLVSGTHKTNYADARAKGRHPAGERHGMAKLTDDDVRIIRRSNDSLSVLGRRYGVTKQAIAYARKGKGWLHVRDDDAKG